MQQLNTKMSSSIFLMYKSGFLTINWWKMTIHKLNNSEGILFKVLKINDIYLFIVGDLKYSFVFKKYSMRNFK